MDIHSEEHSTVSETNVYLLFIALIMGILNNYISVILKYVCVLRNKFSQSSYYHSLRQQLADLQKESAQVDMTNEFARYARLQRKIIKVQDELKKEVSVQKEIIMKNKMILRVFVGVVCIVVMYSYNSQPVVRLDPAWVYPVGRLLCWPGDQLGTISFVIWCAISNSVLRTFL